jgi:hypothetical protein
MKKCILPIFLPFFLLGLVFNTCTYAQVKPPILQHVAFKDRVLERNLTTFASKSRATVISVTLEKRANAYWYKLAGIYFHDNLKNYPTTSWGQWRNRIIVFYSGPAVRDVCTISDSTAFSNLLLHVRPLLMDRDKPVNTGKSEPDLSISAEGLEWTFNVENGKEVWLWTNDGYDSRDFIIPDSK